jgi:hypothetical protein
MTLVRRLIIAALACLVAAATAHGQQQLHSRVEIAWNRFYDYDEVTSLLHRLVEAYPDLLSLQSLGQSVEKREMWLVTLNSAQTGADTEKPAMWIDGNIHGNEIQATETVLYSIWYLASAYGQVEHLTELVDRTAFYFVPMVNPDGRANWFKAATTPHAFRSGLQPTDNDLDGLFDEDAPEDLNGDGQIGTMWRSDPNGTHRRHIDEPRLFEAVEPGKKGKWSFAGSEGIDNDGDGRSNEDGPGGYDMNRNWPSGWHPNHVQFGAGEYPFSYPETRAVGQFVLSHPNIAAGQAYHNAGGMILRGPGAAFRENLYDRSDREVYDRLGRAGEEMLPFYRYMIIHADLYVVHGGFVNWLAEGLGIVSFTNELWNDGRILQDPQKRLDERGELRWQDRMLFGQTFSEWTEFDHPIYGKVLIGGGTKFSSRIPPPFMLEEECHRNFAFTMFHADNMPLLRFSWIDVRQLGDDLWQITVEVANDKIIPSRLSLAAQRKIGNPDRISLQGEGVTVVASGMLSDRVDTTLEPVEHRPHIIDNESGIPGEGQRVFRFFVTGAAGAELELAYSADKARRIAATVALQKSEVDGAAP